jgi:divalent metal cation (Fe/Co/Zn/Cd) transporter
MSGMRPQLSVRLRLTVTVGGLALVLSLLVALLAPRTVESRLVDDILAADAEDSAASIASSAGVFGVLGGFGGLDTFVASVVEGTIADL